MSVILSVQLFGLGEDPAVVAGNPVFESPDSKTQMIHAPDKTAINFKKFNIAEDETVRFIQPHPHSTVLCRVTGGQPSLIEGILEASGRLLLINPASIVFRETAQVRVGSLVASTLDIKDEDFAKGNSRFFLHSGSQDSVIINQGNIAAEHDVIFMAPQILNSGVIAARAENIEFLGGELIALDFEGDHLISFAIESPLKTGFIEPGGQLSAVQGDVYLKLRVASELIRSVVNVNGLVEACTIQKENGVVRLVGDIQAKNKISVDTEQRIHWQGGKMEARSADVEFRASDLILDSPITGPFKTLSFVAKTIDQNSAVNAKSAPIVYDASLIYLGGDVSTSNKDITFKGDVRVDSQVKIIGGYSSGGKITFAGNLNADHSTCLLEINNGKGTVDFQKEIGGPLGELRIIKTGKLLMTNVGVHHLNIRDSVLDLHETAILHAHQQTWSNTQIVLREGQTATFLSDGGPMVFTADCKLQLEPQTQVFFESKKGGIEMPAIFGDHQQSVRVNGGQGSVKTSEMLGKLGELHVQGRDILLGGKIEAASIFMEADHHIQYGKTSQGTTYDATISSKGDVILNAKHGMIGSNEKPIDVDTKGLLYVGAKSMAYLDGNSADGYPHVYAKNPPPRLIFKGHEVQYLFIEEIFAEEESLMSLMPDLFHVIPGGFMHSLMVTPRRAPIYWIK